MIVFKTVLLSSLTVLVIGVASLARSQAQPANAEFSFHLFAEPHSLDPQLTTSASGNYLFYNLYRGLFRYNDEQGLIPDGASACHRDKQSLVCSLRPSKFSNGEPIRAADYVAAFRRLIDPSLASPQADVLFTVKNAKAIWDRNKTVEQLGVSAIDPLTLKIELEIEDPELEYKLIHPALSPLPPGGFLNKDKAADQVTSGPYRISEWKSGGWIRILTNVHYHIEGPRPPVRIYFVDDDPTALTMYETGKMKFLRRVVAGDIPRMRKLPGFKQFPMARFDYMGFGPDLDDKPDLREALVHSVDFPQFKKLFDTFTPPGCPSLPARFMDRVPCQQFDPAAAKKALAKFKGIAPKDYRFSRMGGDDIARAAEWFQGQWKKNLGLTFEIKGEEQAVYLRSLRVRAPAIFRKGVSLDRPTCLGALEIFTKNHPENYIRLNDATYERLVGEVSAARSESTKKAACRKAVEHLLAINRLIPLGEMFFTTMARPDFSGWTLNSLNQLDLTYLKAAKP